MDRIKTTDGPSKRTVAMKKNARTIKGKVSSGRPLPIQP
jgi:hypothetical protein